MIEIELRAGVPSGREVDVLVVPWFDDEAGREGWWRDAAERWLSGQPPGATEPSGWAAVGCGDRPDLFVARLSRAARAGSESVRRAAGLGVRAARERGAGSVGVALPPYRPDEAAAVWQSAAEGAALGDWRHDQLRAEDRRQPPVATRMLCFESAADVNAAGEAVRRGVILAEAQNAARELVSLPGNVVTPRYLAGAAERMATEHGFAARVWGEAELRKDGFGGLLAVARGSEEEPCFVRLEHEGAGGDPYVVVGKGVTFDAGGISLKPAKGMEAMKYDMAGAAAVLGVLVAAARLDIPQRVVGLVPATENLPSGTAVKPGDVIRGLSGKSIEVINTDAEGRLILSDALTYAQRLSPRAIVDMATLTGACVIALGHHAIGMMTTSDVLAEQLVAAGESSGERVWRLPLWHEYRSQLDSEIADIKNTGGRPASAITAGWFLRDFVDDGVEWAHLDIAGTAWAEEARHWQPKGATGVGVRLVHEWLRLRV